MKHRITELKKESRHGYAASYQVTVNHLESFTHKTEIAFNEITIPFLNDFKGHLRQVNKARVNTLRIYLNNIRSVFYHAIDNEIIKDYISPFRKFKIEQEKSAKRSLDITDLQALLALRPLVTKQQQRAIDIFFLIFYLCGINLKDLLYLRTESVHKGRILYKRFKTGRDYSIKIFPQAKEILDRYPGKKYLLNFMDLKEKGSSSRRQEYDHDILSQENKLLKTIVKTHLTQPDQPAPFHVTTYSARHSWATIASKLNISKDIISAALGHNLGSETTSIYIDFDLAKVDRANGRVIRALRSK
jgi:integrase